MNGEVICYVAMAYCLVVLGVLIFLLRSFKVAELPAFKEIGDLYRDTDDVLKKLFLIGRVAGAIWLKRAGVGAAVAVILASFTFLSLICGVFPDVVEIIRTLTHLGRQLRQ